MRDPSHPPYRAHSRARSPLVPEYARAYEFPTSRSHEFNWRAVRCTTHFCGYSLSHAYAKAMSSKNTMMVTKAKSTSAIPIHILSRALYALSGTRELLLRGVGRVVRPP